MDVKRIVSELDDEISRLQQIRSALTSLNGNLGSTGRPGRPRGSKTVKTTIKRQRTLTPEGRKRIAEAMKRRWAEHRKAAK